MHVLLQHTEISPRQLAQLCSYWACAGWSQAQCALQQAACQLYPAVVAALHMKLTALKQMPLCCAAPRCAGRMFWPTDMLTAAEWTHAGLPAAPHACWWTAPAQACPAAAQPPALPASNKHR